MKFTEIRNSVKRNRVRHRGSSGPVILMHVLLVAALLQLMAHRSHGHAPGPVPMSGAAFGESSDGHNHNDPAESGCELCIVASGLKATASFTLPLPFTRLGSMLTHPAFRYVSLASYGPWLSRAPPVVS